MCHGVYLMGCVSWCVSPLFALMEDKVAAIKSMCNNHKFLANLIEALNVNIVSCKHFTGT